MTRGDKEQHTTGAAAVGEKWPIGQVSLGIASVLLASSAVAQTTLPPVSVEAAKKAPAKKAKAAKTQAPAAEPTTAPAVTGAPPSPPNALQATTGLGRVGTTVKDIPQSVSVISREQIQQQNITSLDQALRNVPGVTVSVGEGNGGMNGDQFRIRGFQAKGDIYVDGLRDFGVYVRDAFAYEQVQVIKGPSAESFGMGTTGGAINVQQKTAHLGDANSIEQTIGMGPMSRTIVDINKQINATTAVRAVGMYHEQDLVDRDHVFSDRWGFLGSVGFGLGTDTSLTVNYMHQSGNRQPDMGGGLVDPFNTGTKKPVYEFGVSRSNYYGTSLDTDESEVDMLTARLTHKVAPGLTIYNDTRVAAYSRYWAQTTFRTCPEATCEDQIASGDLDNAFHTHGGPEGRDQQSWGIQNITTAVAKFKTGSLRHEAAVGADVWYQNEERQSLTVYNSLTGTTGNHKQLGSVGSPQFRQPSYLSLVPSGDPQTGDAVNWALFASDRVWLTPQISVLGGVRHDTYSIDFNGYSQETSFTSPKASLIWEPTKSQTYYVSWARSYSGLAGQFLTNDNSPISSDSEIEPEESELWEVGAKLSFLNDRLGVTGALFRIDKSNAMTESTTVPGEMVPSGMEQRVQGVELGLTGKLTNEWTLQASYTYLDSEILSDTGGGGSDSCGTAGSCVGKKVVGVPEHAFSLWTTYDIAKMLNVRGTLLLGGGLTYTDETFGRSLNDAIIPSSLVFDGLISYEADGWRYAVNGYNLTDERYYDATFSNRAVLAPGRTVLFTIGRKF